MNFAAGLFLLALTATAAPIVIHLMNRRRYRVVQWAAMDFLAGAVKKNRRTLELRDLILLLLRIALLVFFVIAMARPYCSQRVGGWDGRGAGHVILVIDNSMSMGHRPLNERRLDIAKREAIEMIDELPAGSVVTLLPTCEDAHGLWRDDFTSLEDAKQALQQIQLVDRSTHMMSTLERAYKATQRAPELKGKQVVWLGDIAQQDWDQPEIADAIKRLPGMHLKQPAEGITDNTWVQSLNLRDGLADTRSAAVFFVRIRHEGALPRENVRVRFFVDEKLSQERVVDLTPGQDLELSFKHEFSVSGAGADAVFVPVHVRLDQDHLPEDDVRYYLAPVMSRVPVVFIDELGAENESPAANLYGATFLMRRMLNPITADDDDARLFTIKHVTMDDVDKELLSDARLVVIAGVTEPDEDATDVLTEYVRQGGQILMSTGGSFNPERWNSIAWRDGEGILPVPLKTEPIGVAPMDAVAPEGFHLDPQTIMQEGFSLNLTATDIESITKAPVFYKAIGIDESVINNIPDMDRQRIQMRRDRLKAHDEKETEWSSLEARGELTEAMEDQRARERQQINDLFPEWLSWRNPLALDERDWDLEELIKVMRPIVLGRYTNGEVFALSRRLGKGKLAMITTDTQLRWNTLPGENGVVLLIQMMRGMITDSLPGRNKPAANAVDVPLLSSDLNGYFRLVAPDGQNVIAMEPEALGAHRFGLRLRGLAQRGIYTIVCTDEAPIIDDQNTNQPARWEMKLAINGPGSEGDLTPMPEKEWQSMMEDAPVKKLNAADPLTIDQNALSGTGLWKMLMWLALATLIGESMLLTWLSRRAG